MRATITEYLRRNVLGVVAIFLALGGVSYAAGLAPNSVKSKHIKNGQVKGIDLKNGSVGAADLAVRPSQTVRPNPHTLSSDPCPGQNGIFCGQDSAPGIYSGWENVDTSEHEGATFFKDLSGVVHLQGLVKRVLNFGTDIFYLPPGYRPANHLVFGADSTGTKHSKIDIYANGAVRWFTANGDSASGYLSLSGITFRAR